MKSGMAAFASLSLSQVYTSYSAVRCARCGGNQVLAAASSEASPSGVALSRLKKALGSPAGGYTRREEFGRMDQRSCWMSVLQASKFDEDEMHERPAVSRSATASLGLTEQMVVVKYDNGEIRKYKLNAFHRILVTHSPGNETCDLTVGMRVSHPHLGLGARMRHAHCAD